MRLKPTFALVLAAAAALAAPAAHDAAAQKKGGDLFWTAPDLANHTVRSIAFMPAVSFDNNLKTEQTVEGAMALAIKGKAYTWRSPVSVLALLKAMKGDSLWAAQREAILKNERVDSLAAPALCRITRTNALLTLRIDLYERRNLEWNEAGKPSTSVKLKAALVDSTGRLLWTASGSETLEGPYQEPNAGVVGVKGSGLGTQPMTGVSGAPAYEEVIAKLLERWTPNFPAPPPPKTP